LQRVDPGFDPHNLLTLQLLGDPLNAPTPEARAAMVGQIEQRLRSIPGVQSVTHPVHSRSPASSAPFAGERKRH